MNHEPTKHFRSLPFLIIIFIILFAFSVWYYIYQLPVQQYGNNDEEVFTATSMVETADWKTYKNEKYGFEFNYSKDWKVFATSDSSVGDIFYILKSNQNTKNLSGVLSVYKYNLTNLKSLEDIEKYEQKIDLETQKIYPDVKGRIYMTLLGFDSNQRFLNIYDEEQENRENIFFKNDHAYNLEYNQSIYSQSDLSEINKIIHSFKFTK